MPMPNGPDRRADRRSTAKQRLRRSAVRALAAAVYSATLSASVLAAPNNDDTAAAYPPLLVQPGEEAPSPQQPIVPRDEATDQRLSALSLFMQGQLHERRRELAEALDSYERAIDRDPTSIAIYESYIPLAYLLGSPDDAVAAAKRAAAMDGDGQRLIRSLGALMLSTGLSDRADALLTEALLIPRIRDSRFASLLMRRDLAAVKYTLDRNAESAQLFKTVFDSLTSQEAEPSEATPEDGEPADGEPATGVAGRSESSEPRLSEAERAELLGEPGETYEKMGEVFLAAELPDLAVAAFERASAFRTARPGLHSYNLATVFRKKGESAKALESLEGYLAAQLRSKGVAAYEMLKELLADLGRSDDLIPRLKDLVERDRLNQTLRFFLADELFAAGRLDEARTEYERGLGGGTDPRGLIGLLAVQRQSAEPAALLDSIIKLYPVVMQAAEPAQRAQLPDEMQSALARLEGELDAVRSDEPLLDGVVAEATERAESNRLAFLPTYVVGKVLLDADRPADAAAFYRRAIEIRNEPPPQLYEEIGQALHEDGQYAEAAAFFREAAESNSAAIAASRFIFYYFLAHSEAFAENPEAASAAIEQALELKPDMPLLRFEQAWIPYFAKDYDAAIPLLESIIADYAGSEEPEKARVLRNSQFSLSNLYVQRGEVDAGVAVLEGVLAEEPDSTQANNDLGYLLADNDRELDRALRLIRKAIAAEPENPAYLDSLGWVLHKLGRDLEAVEPLRRAASMEGGQDAVIYEHLAAAERAIGNDAMARRAYETALELETAKGSPDQEVVERLKAGLASLPAPADDRASDPEDEPEAGVSE